jgi:two-component system OmpR family response regulator
VEPNGPIGNGDAQRILVVDDEPSIVDAVATALRYEGFEVEEAASGRAAIEVAAAFEPDLIVLDWMLPDIDGIEVGRRLRALGFNSAVLFLTAKDGTENKVEALRAGGDDYVTKPFSLAEVVARTQAILRRTAGAPATCCASETSSWTRAGTRSSEVRRSSS